MTAWAEDRAPWRHDPSADPGAKTEGGRHDAALSFPFGIGTKAENRWHLITRTLPYLAHPVSPFHAEPVQMCRPVRRCNLSGRPFPDRDSASGREDVALQR